MIGGIQQGLLGRNKGGGILLTAIIRTVSATVILGRIHGLTYPSQHTWMWFLFDTVVVIFFRDVELVKVLRHIFILL